MTIAAEIFTNSDRNFWSNGSRPKMSFPVLRQMNTLSPIKYSFDLTSVISSLEHHNATWS